MSEIPSLLGSFFTFRFSGAKDIIALMGLAASRLILSSIASTPCSPDTVWQRRAAL
jgi:hypothetical protein